MKKTVCLFTIVCLYAICVSCSSDRDMIVLKHRNETGIWNGGRNDTAEDTIIADTAVYVTTVEFPDDYFWQKDTVGEGRTFKLCLYANGKKILSLNGGPEYEIGADPDMHRVIDGHLYSDWSGIANTVILEDGKKLFQYEGREMLCGFLKKDGAVYTLGQNRGGKGVALRRNGETLFRDDTGIAIGEMSCPCSESGGLYSVDSGDIVFFYQVPVQSALKQKFRLFKVVNGVPEELELSSEIEKIHDVRIIDGEMYIACNRNDKDHTPALYYGESTVSWKTLDYALANFRLRWTPGGRVCVRLDFSADKWKNSRSVLLGMRKESITVRGGGLAYDFYPTEEGYAYVSANEYEESVFTSFLRDDGSKFEYETPGASCFMGSMCATVCGDKFYAGLSSLDKFGTPVLVVNGKATTLDINGYISGVKVIAPGG